jgi:predicted transposase/invertase (TIGR01784 family)
VSTPHDDLVKFIFKTPENAAGLLRTLLPAEVAKLLDWSTLRLEDSSLQPEAGTELRTDMLYSIAMGDGKSSAFLYVVVEHQSSLDARMPLRMLKYLAAAYGRITPPRGPVPVIIPVVISHVDGGWKGARSFWEMLELGPAVEAVLGTYIPRFELLIDDLARTAEEELRARALTDAALLTLLLLKTARTSKTLPADLERWFEIFKAAARLPNGVVAVTKMLEYALKVGEVAPQPLVQMAGRIHPDVAESVMTGAEQLRQEGRQEGIVQGEATLLLKLLRRKFGDVPTSVEQRLMSASTAEIERYGELVLTANTLDEVLN